MSTDIEFPESLDALIAAPDHHELLLENDTVRVLDSLVKPGESTPVHTHQWPAVLYIVGTSDFVRKDAEGNVIFDSRDGDGKLGPGTAVWSGPLAPHCVTNVGDGEIRVVSVEIKK
jgi:quercetin dioxygenase-like cupin family protein